MTAKSYSQSAPQTEPSAREIVISRIFAAPCELVFQAWTDPEQVVQWWGPTGFKTTTLETDVRPGGVWRFIMHGPDGRDYPNRIVFDEMVEPERLIYTQDGEEGPVQIKFQTTVTFERYGADQRSTKLTMRTLFRSPEERDLVTKEYGAVEGGIEHAGRLAKHLEEATGIARAALTLALPSERDIVMHRVFDAPRHLVFEAFSKAEHIRNWWGCRTFETTICEIDFRPGGAWRIVQRAPDGQEHPFKGMYKEIVAPERLVQSFIYDVEGIREHPSIETMTFAESNGTTILTLTVRHESQEARDGHLRSGMESGAAESFDRLAELVAAMSASEGQV